MNLKEILFENKGFKQTIFKNTFWLTVSQIAVRLLKLVLVIYVARKLSIADYGKFNWALSFVTLFTVLADLGINSISIREFAQDQNNEKHIADLFGLKMFLGIAVCLLIIFYSSFFVQDFAIRIMFWILATYAVIIAFDGLFLSFFQAREKMEYIAWADIIQGASTVIFGLFFVFKWNTSIALSWAYLFSAILYTLFFIIAFKICKQKFKIAFDFKIWFKFLKMSWPLAMAGIFGVIYTSTDSVMLGWFSQFEAVAFYNAAQKFIWIAVIPAGLIYSSFFPAINKIIDQEKERFQKAWSFQLEIMFAIAIPMVVGILVLAPKIIEFGFGSNYFPAIGALKMLTAVLFLSYLSHPFNQLLVSFHRQKYLFWISCSTAILNMILNAILIPQYSFYGAGIATIASYFSSLVLSIYFCKKSVNIDLLNSNLIISIFISLISSVLMFLVINHKSIYSLNIFVVGILGILIYFIIFGILRTKLLSKLYQ